MGIVMTKLPEKVPLNEACDDVWNVYEYLGMGRKEMMQNVRIIEPSDLLARTLMFIHSYAILGDINLRNQRGSDHHSIRRKFIDFDQAYSAKKKVTTLPCFTDGYVHPAHVMLSNYNETLPEDMKIPLNPALIDLQSLLVSAIYDVIGKFFLSYLSFFQVFILR